MELNFTQFKIPWFTKQINRKGQWYLGTYSSGRFLTPYYNSPRWYIRLSYKLSPLTPKLYHQFHVWDAPIENSVRCRVYVGPFGATLLVNLQVQDVVSSIIFVFGSLTKLSFDTELKENLIIILIKLWSKNNLSLSLWFEINLKINIWAKYYNEKIFGLKGGLNGCTSD